MINQQFDKVKRSHQGMKRAHREDGCFFNNGFLCESLTVLVRSLGHCSVRFKETIIVSSSFFTGPVDGKSDLFQINWKVLSTPTTGNVLFNLT